MFIKNKKGFVTIEVIIISSVFIILATFFSQKLFVVANENKTNSISHVGVLDGNKDVIIKHNAKSILLEELKSDEKILIKDNDKFKFISLLNKKDYLNKDVEIVASKIGPACGEIKLTRNTKAKIVQYSNTISLEINKRDMSDEDIINNSINANQNTITFCKASNLKRDSNIAIISYVYNTNSLADVPIKHIPVYNSNLNLISDDYVGYSTDKE